MKSRLSALILIAVLVAPLGSVATGTADAHVRTVRGLDSTVAILDSTVSDSVSSVLPDGAQRRPRVEVDATRVDRSPRLRYELRVSELEDVERLVLVVGRNARLVSADGFERVETDSARLRLRWTGDSQARAVLTTDTLTAEDGTSAEYFATSDWMLGPVPYAELQWRTAGSSSVQRIRPFGDRQPHLRDDDRAVFGDRYALVGSHRKVSRQAGDQEVTFVVPREASVEAGSTAVLDSVAAAGRSLEVGDRDEAVLMYALPDPARAGGESFPARDESWVHAASPVDDPNNVWVHEYVHTRQSFRLADGMTWFREASAEYYAARLTYEQGRIDRAAMDAHLRGDSAGEAVLTRPSTWTDEQVPYTKGARVLAALDRHIEERTDGRRSLEDVFRRMNRHEGRVSYADFERMVAAVAGHSMDAWLDRHVDGPAPVEDPDTTTSDRWSESLLATLGPGGPTLPFGATVLTVALVTVLPVYGALQYLDRSVAGDRHSETGSRLQ